MLEFTHGQIVAMADYLSKNKISTKGTTVTELFLLFYNHGGNLQDIGVSTKGCSFEESDIQQGFSGKIYAMTSEEKTQEDSGFFRGFKIFSLPEKEEKKEEENDEYFTGICQAWLTRNGNVLLLDAKGRYSFHTPELELIRECSYSEGNYIVSCNPLQIKIERTTSNHLSDFLYYASGEKEFPTWYFIKSITVMKDDSNYRWETGSNGGDYSFSLVRNWYCAKINGKWQFAHIDSHSTSADFSFDELNGDFQSDLGMLILSNTSDQSTFQSQAGIEWDGREKYYQSEEVLEKFATMSSFGDMWSSQCEYIPSRWGLIGDSLEAYTSPALTFSDKKEIVQRLHELGVTKKSIRKSHKSNRR
jgi:hypothetical protein